MKNIYKALLLLCFLLPFSSQMLAQMVGDNVFLKGKFVEVGIAPNGGYGSTLAAPAGYHPNLGTTFTFWDPGAGAASTSGSFLGFVADYGADGWTVGAPPFFGDYYMPGFPQEGWAIQVGTAVSEAYIPAYNTSIATTGYTGTLAGTNVAYVSSGGVSKGVWQGTNGPLAIRQTTILDTSKLYFTVNVVLTNTGATTTPNIYYVRTLDPDNEEVTVGPTGYTTINTITYQLPNPTNRVLVSATGTVFTNAYLGLGTKDCRAKCMIFDGGLAPTYDLDQMWNQTTTYFYTQGTVYTSDVGIALEYNIGTLAPGDSTSLSYAYILNAAYIDSALNSTKPTFTVNGVAHDSTDTINLCTYVPDSIKVQIPGGGFYHWSWAPDSFLTDTTGINVVIHSDSITSNITYTITGTNVAGGCNAIKYLLTVEHGTFPGPVVTPTIYCQNDVAVPLTAPGTDLSWWTSATGGTSSPTAPTPSTAVPGTFIYYVSEQVDLCQSLRSPDTVIVKPLPPPPTLSGTNPYCQGQTFNPFLVAGTGVLWYTASTGGTGSATAPVVPTGVPGTYTYYASQTINGCEGPRQPITTTVLDSIIPVFSYVIHYGCHGDTVLFTNSSVNATHYNWNFGDGHSDTATNPVHVYLTQGSFTVSLYGANGACVDSEVKTIPLIHPLQASFTNNPDIACQGTPFTFTNTSVGTTPLAYNWDFGNGAVAASTDATYTYANSGTYTVRLIATDFVPCSDTATATIYVDTISGIQIALTDSVTCGGTYVTLTGLFASLGNTGVSWDFGEGGDSLKNVNPVYHGFSATTPSQYTISLTALYRACPTVSTTKTITVFPQPNIYLGPDTSICIGSESITISAMTTNMPGATWLWNTGQTGSSINVVAPGAYFATVNVNNCFASDTVMVSNDCYMDIPNVFTPNGDGLNDYFFPRQFLTKGLKTFTMNIYNRWGQLIFETNSLDGRGWDGKLNGVPQPQGVFVFIIDATFRDGQKEHHQGNVTLLR